MVVHHPPFKQETAVQMVIELRWRRCLTNPCPRAEKVRAAEMAAALSLATDLGMGSPFEHGLHATLLTMRLAELLGVDRETAWETHHRGLRGSSRRGVPSRRFAGVGVGGDARPRAQALARFRRGLG